MNAFVRHLAAVGLLAGAGVLTGASTMALNPVEEIHAGCENDECDRWLFWERCRDNPGGLTQCVHRGRGCVTLACHQALVPE